MTEEITEQTVADSTAEKNSSLSPPPSPPPHHQNNIVQEQKLAPISQTLPSSADDDNNASSNTTSSATETSPCDSDDDDDSDDELTSIVDERPENPEDELKIITKLEKYGSSISNTNQTRCAVSMAWTIRWKLYTNFDESKKTLTKYLQISEALHKKNLEKIEQRKKEREERAKNTDEKKKAKKKNTMWDIDDSSSDSDDYYNSSSDDDEEFSEDYNDSYGKGKKYDYRKGCYVYEDEDKEFLREHKEYKKVPEDAYQVKREDGVIVDCIINPPGPIKNADLIMDGDPYYEKNLEAAKKLHAKMKEAEKKEKEEEEEKNKTNKEDASDDEDIDKKLSKLDEIKDQTEDVEVVPKHVDTEEKEDNEANEEEEEISLEKHVYLKDDVEEEVDFMYVSSTTYDQLSRWYGDDVRYEEQADAGKFKLCMPFVDKYPDIKFTTPFKESWSITKLKEEVIKTMCLTGKVKPEDIRLSDYWGNRKIATITPKYDLSRLYDKNDIIVEFRDKDGNFPKTETETRTYNYGSGSSYGYSYNAPAMEHPGLCGLRNLGNTCFMNSSLQCMSNTKPLKDFLLSDDWKTHINTDNPLGTGGKLTEAFRELIHKMWRGDKGVVSPSNFKEKLGDFAPQFSGYQQHDSHELLSYLLDGLHEDLNLIKKKPYVEAPDYVGQPIEQWAKESWDRFLLRNKSVIVDLFMGQFKSTTQCPDCGKESIVCDAFSTISVPLPGYNTKNYVVVVHIPMVNRVIKMSLQLNAYGKFKDLKRGVVDFLKQKNIYEDASTENLSVADVYGSRVYKWFNEDDLLSSIGYSNPHCYFEQIGEGEVKMEIMCATESRYQYSSYLDKVGDKMFGNVRKATTYNRLLIDALRIVLNEKDCKESFTKFVTKQLAELNGDNNNDKEEIKIDNNNSDSDDDDDEMKIGVEAKKKKSDTDEPTEPSSSIAVTEPEENVVENKCLELNIEEEDANKEEVVEKVTNKIDGEDKEVEVEEEEEEDLGDNLLEGVTNTEVVRALAKVVKIFYGDSYCRKDSEVPQTGEFALDTSKSVILLIKEELKVAIFGTSSSWSYSYASSSSSSTKETVEDFTVSNDDDSKEITLDDCLKLFTERDQLGEEDQWYCPQCKDFKRAFRKMEVWKAAPLLIINIKRFNFQNKYHRDKLETLVKFPIEGLDMGKYILSKKEGEDLIYDLYAVSNHFGSLGGGHYTAYAKNADLNEWYNFNDSSVSKVTDTSEIVSSAAYTLFYVRRGYTFDPSSSLASSLPDSNNAAAVGDVAGAGNNNGDGVGEEGGEGNMEDNNTENTHTDSNVAEQTLESNGDDCQMDESNELDEVY